MSEKAPEQAPETKRPNEAYVRKMVLAVHAKVDASARVARVREIMESFIETGLSTTRMPELDTELLDHLRFVTPSDIRIEDGMNIADVCRGVVGELVRREQLAIETASLAKRMVVETETYLKLFPQAKLGDPDYESDSD